MNLLSDLLGDLSHVLFFLIATLSSVYFITTLVSLMGCRRKRNPSAAPKERLPSVTVQITSLPVKGKVTTDNKSGGLSLNLDKLNAFGMSRMVRAFMAGE